MTKGDRWESGLVKTKVPQYKDRVSVFSKDDKQFNWGSGRRLVSPRGVHTKRKRGEWRSVVRISVGVFLLGFYKRKILILLILVGLSELVQFRKPSRSDPWLLERSGGIRTVLSVWGRESFGPWSRERSSSTVQDQFPLPPLRYLWVLLHSCSTRKVD